ncbi:VOC family protein [Saccharopolyspora taberi]|uniref:VOC domain-containing protein n=1 Tax=Saccharopolyspora taberi TaxID=60895 RepID=A0ABN3V383_9PSEU
MVSTTGVNELVLESRDLEAAERFYTEVLGFPVIERWNGTPTDAVWVLAGGTRIGLWKPAIGISGGRPGVHVHYALSVDEDDYDSVIAEVRSHGVKVDEVEFGGQARSAYVTDPDGNVVEFWTWDVSRGGPGAPRAVTEGIENLPKRD